MAELNWHSNFQKYIGNLVGILPFNLPVHKITAKTALSIFRTIETINSLFNFIKIDCGVEYCTVYVASVPLDSGMSCLNYQLQQERRLLWFVDIPDARMRINTILSPLHILLFSENMVISFQRGSIVYLG